MLAPVIGSPASWSQKSVWRYSSSAGVATVAMALILGRAAARWACLELVLERPEALLRQGDKRARGGRQPAPAARDDREGVVDRLGERDPAEAVGQPRAEREQ